MTVIQVLLVDDHSVVRHGIWRLLTSEPDLSVCAEADGVVSAIKLAGEFHPDVVLLDAKLPDGNGGDACRKIKALCPNTKIVVLSAYADEQTVTEMVSAGVDSYLLKDIDGPAIVDAIRSTAAGNSVIDPSLAGTVMQILSHRASGRDLLSDRERQILSLVAAGKTNKEVGAGVGITEKAVRNSLSRIMKKIGAGNRTEAALYWHQKSTMTNNSKPQQL